MIKERRENTDFFILVIKINIITGNSLYGLEKLSLLLYITPLEIMLILIIN